MRRTRKEWTEIVGRYQTSGLTLRQFCHAENIGEQNLRHWKKRIMQECGSNYNVGHGFVEVQAASDTVQQESPTAQGNDSCCRRKRLIIRFRDDTVIEVQPDTDRNTLAWVLALMVNR